MLFAPVFPTILRNSSFVPNASMNGHVLDYIQFLLQHILIERAHPGGWSGRLCALAVASRGPH